MITSMRCDRPMAEKKGLLPCGKRCRTCVACIKTDEFGREGHVWFKEGSDPSLMLRNLRLRSYYGETE